MSANRDVNQNLFKMILGYSPDGVAY
jgi:hypothetical protein